MIPVIVDPQQVAIALIGRGGAAQRRLEQLFEAGAERLTIYSDLPAPELASTGAAIGRYSALARRLPPRAPERQLAMSARHPPQRVLSPAR